MKPRKMRLALGLWLALVAVTIPPTVQAFVSCSPNPCKNGASCVSSNPTGESHCKEREQERRPAQRDGRVVGSESAPEQGRFYLDAVAFAEKSRRDEKSVDGF
ncbi:hypothetical protein HPB47_025780 [Ixodes persulcatus]|uniref:Uncharacterized protein n=1 Tax=Ixodes persulcatus TaxID=34615 RepID=A0AC60Q0U3_IXOPE|nr:hypothetical protein HPB47_025780 [Ixodes persulcatus]